jgi:uncharacterized membrane protein YccC
MNDSEIKVIDVALAIVIGVVLAFVLFIGLSS